MKKLWAVFLALALLLTGCGTEQKVFDDTAFRAEADLLLGTFQDRDFDTCRMIVREEISDEDLKGIFDAICGVLNDFGAYEMTLVTWNQRTTGDQEMTAVQYLVEAENDRFYLDLTMETDVSGIAAFRVTEIREGTEPAMPMGPVNLAIVLAGGAIVGFVIWMMVDCARRKMKRKWLWMPLILLGTLILTLTMGQSGLRFGFRVGLFLGMSNLTNFVRGGFQLMLYIPLGALVYFFKRKDLTAADEQEPVTALEE